MFSYKQVYAVCFPYCMGVMAYIFMDLFQLGTIVRQPLLRWRRCNVLLIFAVVHDVVSDLREGYRWQVFGEKICQLFF